MPAKHICPHRNFMHTVNKISSHCIINMTFFIFYIELKMMRSCAGRVKGSRLGLSATRGPLLCSPLSLPAFLSKVTACAAVCGTAELLLHCLIKLKSKKKKTVLFNQYMNGSHCFVPESQ